MHEYEFFSITTPPSMLRNVCGTLQFVWASKQKFSVTAGGNGVPDSLFIDGLVLQKANLAKQQAVLAKQLKKIPKGTDEWKEMKVKVRELRKRVKKFDEGNPQSSLTGGGEGRAHFIKIGKIFKKAKDLQFNFPSTEQMKALEEDETQKNNQKSEGAWYPLCM